MTVMFSRFLLTRPLRDVTQFLQVDLSPAMISTHTPLAGRDAARLDWEYESGISTHTPLAGRDGCGRRQELHVPGFLLTRPLRDVTLVSCNCFTIFEFLLTRPLRDVT